MREVEGLAKWGGPQSVLGWAVVHPLHTCSVRENDAERAEANP